MSRQCSGYTNDPAGGSSARVSRLEALIVSSPSKVICALVNYYCSSNDTPRSTERNEIVFKVEMHNTMLVALYIAQIADMPLQV